MREEEIIRRLRKQDAEGLKAFTLHYSPLMRYIIAPILPDPREQEECLADLHLHIWDRIHLFDPNKGSFTAWLTALTRNAALNRAKTLQRQPQSEELSPHLPDGGETPEEALLRKERQQALAQAVGRLSERDQILFFRKYYYYQSTTQIAAETGLSERAVEGRLYRLRQRLRTLLGGDIL